MRSRFVLPCVAVASVGLSGCGGGSSSSAAAQSSAVRASNLAAVAAENSSPAVAPKGTAQSSASQSSAAVKPAAPALVDAQGNPIIPAAARAHTDAGAIAFTKYYWALLDSLDAQPRTGVITKLAASGCAICVREEAGYADNKQRQLVVIPARSTLTNIRVTQRNTSAQLVAVQFDMKHAASQEWREGKRGEFNPEARFSSVVLLKWVPEQGWRVLDIGFDQK